MLVYLYLREVKFKDSNALYRIIVFKKKTVIYIRDIQGIEDTLTLKIENILNNITYGIIPKLK